jgi:hypothetical protein
MGEKTIRLLQSKSASELSQRKVPLVWDFDLFYAASSIFLLFNSYCF